MRFPKRRWRESAENAIAGVHTERERQAIAQEVAARLGAQMRSGHGGHTRLVCRVAELIDEASVRVALASRYVAGLQERVATADYEEAAALRRELAWVRLYLEEKLLCPLIMAPEMAHASRNQGYAGSVLDPLYETLTRAVGGHLVINDEAAA